VSRETEYICLNVPIHVQVSLITVILTATFVNLLDLEEISSRCWRV